MNSNETRNALIAEPRQTLIKALVESVVDDWMNQGLFRTCLNCDHWRDNPAANMVGCNLYRQMPPPKVVAVGCDDHSDMIPF